MARGPQWWHFGVLLLAASLAYFSHVTAQQRLEIVPADPASQEIRIVPSSGQPILKLKSGEAVDLLVELRQIREELQAIRKLLEPAEPRRYEIPCEKWGTGGLSGLPPGHMYQNRTAADGDKCYAVDPGGSR